MNELPVELPYSGEQFGVPPNLYLLGTLNTADCSIALLDLALRRRFAFVPVLPDPSLLGTATGVDLGSVLANVNLRMTRLRDRNHQIGYSYLLNEKTLTDLRFACYHRAVPLLEEYFYNDATPLLAVLGPEFVAVAQHDMLTDDLLGSMPGGELPHHSIVNLEEPSIPAALRSLAAGSA